MVDISDFPNKYDKDANNEASTDELYSAFKDMGLGDNASIVLAHDFTDPDQPITDFLEIATILDLDQDDNISENEIQTVFDIGNSGAQYKTDLTEEDYIAFMGEERQVPWNDKQFQNELSALLIQYGVSTYGIADFKNTIQSLLGVNDTDTISTHNVAPVLLALKDENDGGALKWQESHYLSDAEKQALLVSNQNPSIDETTEEPAVTDVADTESETEELPLPLNLNENGEWAHILDDTETYTPEQIAQVFSTVTGLDISEQEIIDKFGDGPISDEKLFMDLDSDWNFALSPEEIKTYLGLTDTEATDEEVADIVPNDESEEAVTESDPAAETVKEVSDLLIEDNELMYDFDDRSEYTTAELAKAFSQITGQDITEQAVIDKFKEILGNDYVEGQPITDTEIFYLVDTFNGTLSENEIRRFMGLELVEGPSPTVQGVEADGQSREENNLTQIIEDSYSTDGIVNTAQANAFLTEYMGMEDEEAISYILGRVGNNMAVDEFVNLLTRIAARSDVEDDNDALQREDLRTGAHRSIAMDETILAGIREIGKLFADDLLVENNELQYNDDTQSAYDSAEIAKAFSDITGHDISVKDIEDKFGGNTIYDDQLLELVDLENDTISSGEIRNAMGLTNDLLIENNELVYSSDNIPEYTAQELSLAFSQITGQEFTEQDIIDKFGTSVITTDTLFMNVDGGGGTALSADEIIEYMNA